MNEMSEAISRLSALELADLDGFSADVGQAEQGKRSISPPNLKDRSQHSRGEPSADAKPSYSIFTKHEKLALVLLAAFAATFSPLSSNLYFPALTAIARDLHTSLSQMNFTITSYMIVSGFAPMVLCSVADQLGRRPIYILMFLTYSLACMGLALQRSYPALLLLRMLQSAGGSATLGLGYGIVGDLTESSDRGTFIGILCIGPNVAPTVGPLLGGVISQTAGWPWTFGFLAIFGCLTLLSIVVVLPETARNVVGDGSLPVTYWNKSLLRIWLEARAKRPVPKKPTNSAIRVSWKTKLKVPHLFESFSICCHKCTAPILLLYGIAYAEMNCLQASLSSLFIEMYGYTQLEAGLIYLPFGIGCFIGTLLSSKILSMDYRRLAKRHHLPASSADTSDSQRLIFPIFHARLRNMAYLLPLSNLPLLAYGWLIQYRVHPAVSLILTFFLGGSMTVIFNSCGTLTIDLHPSRPSTAQASINIVRCTLAAAALAAVQPLIDAVGAGWCFTIIASVAGGTGLVCVWIARSFGEGWRRQRQSE